MPRPEYPLKVYADLQATSFAEARDCLLAMATAGHLSILEDDASTLTIQSDHGTMGLSASDDGTVTAVATAEDDRWMFIVKNAIVVQLKKQFPEVTENMRWSDAGQGPVLPPTFTLVTVREVYPVGSAFLRVVLEGDDFAAYGRESIHFRLVQPPKGKDPAWPFLAPIGSVKWPEGEEAPHKPVYTARSIDHAAGTLVTDIFLHEGGQTIEWAREVMSGDRSRANIGIMGPLGGGLLEAQNVLLAADETGMPAAARMLENLPQGVTGTLFLESGEGAGCDYPLNVPDGITVKWLARNEGDSLEQAMIKAMATPFEADVWFAGERGQAARVRDFAKNAGWDPKELRISGFWKAPDNP